MKMRTTFNLLWLALFGCLILAAQPALAQMRAYTTIKAVKWQQLSNAVRVTVQCDGVLQAGPDWEHVTDLVDLSMAQPKPKPTQQLTIVLYNARANIPTFTDISTYPVSHLEVLPLPGATQGIGCKVRLWFYKNAGILHVFDQLNVGRWWDYNYVPLKAEVKVSQDQRSLVFTVYSDRQINTKAKEEAAAALKQRLATSASNLTMTLHDGKLDAYLLNVPLADVVQQVNALHIGAQVLLPDELNPYVTLTALDQDPVQLLQAIADSSGLNLWHTDGQYSFACTSIDSGNAYEASQSRWLKLQHIKVNTALDLLPEFLLKDLKPSPEQNALRLACGKTLAAKVASDLETLDKPPTQVGLALLIVQCNQGEEAQRAFALRYQYRTHFWSTTGESGNVTALLTAPGPILNPLGSLGTYWDALVNAIKTKDTARLRSAPYLVTTCGEEARLFVGETKYVERSNPDTGATEVGPVKLGVELRFTPTVGPDGQVTLEVQASDSSILTQNLTTGQPTLRTAEFKGTVRTASGQTIYVGGLQLERNEVTHSKLPVLGDLPLVGNLFGSKHKLHVRNDLGVFVTPFVLPDAQGFPADQVENLSSAQVLLKSLK